MVKEQKGHEERLKKMFEMFECNNCKYVFDIPEVKKPDAGHVLTPYDFRSDRVEPIRFCPLCLSTKITKIIIPDDAEI